MARPQQGPRSKAGSHSASQPACKLGAALHQVVGAAVAAVRQVAALSWQYCSLEGSPEEQEEQAMPPIASFTTLVSAAHGGGQEGIRSWWVGRQEGTSWPSPEFLPAFHLFCQHLTSAAPRKPAHRTQPCQTAAMSALRLLHCHLPKRGAPFQPSTALPPPSLPRLGPPSAALPPQQPLLTHHHHHPSPAP